MDNMYHRFDYQFFSTDFGRQVKIVHHRFDVIKKTPKGCWIDVYGQKRFVRDNARNRYACESIDLAKESFIARKNRQIWIYKGKIADITSALYHIERFKEKPLPTAYLEDLL